MGERAFLKKTKSTGYERKLGTKRQVLAVLIVEETEGLLLLAGSIEAAYEN